MHFFHSTTAEKIKNIREYGAVFCAKNIKDKLNPDDRDREVSYDDRYGYNNYVFGRLVPHFDYGEYCMELDVPAWMLVVNPLGNHILWTPMLSPNELKGFLMPGKQFEVYWEKNKTGTLNIKELQELYQGRYQELVQKNPVLRREGIKIAELMAPREVPLQYLVKIHVQDDEMMLTK